MVILFLLDFCDFPSVSQSKLFSESLGMKVIEPAHHRALTEEGFLLTSVNNSHRKGWSGKRKR
jgi:hypothetical protein